MFFSLVAKIYAHNEFKTQNNAEEIVEIFMSMKRHYMFLKDEFQCKGYVKPIRDPGILSLCIQVYISAWIVCNALSDFLCFYSFSNLVQCSLRYIYVYILRPLAQYEFHVTLH